MNSSRVLRRWLSLAATFAVLAAVLAVLAVQGSRRDAVQADTIRGNSHSWPLFGGSVSRDLVNLVEKDTPTTWDNHKGREKNIKWSVPLGSKAYGGPIVSGGKIFVGTNNNSPRDPAIRG